MHSGLEEMNFQEAKVVMKVPQLIEEVSMAHVLRHSILGQIHG